MSYFANKDELPTLLHSSMYNVRETIWFGVFNANLYITLSQPTVVVSMQDQFTDAPQLSYSDIASGGEGSSFLDVITTEEAAALVRQLLYVCIYELSHVFSLYLIAVSVC